MKLTILILTAFTISTSGIGQFAVQKVNSENRNQSLAKGETVKEVGNNIMVVFQDTKNNYWFGSWQDGLYKYDGKSIVHFTDKDGLPSNRVEEIKEDKLGNIYFNTNKGLCQFNGIRFTTLKETTGVDNNWILNPDDLWFKSLEHDACLYRFDGKNLYRLKLPATKLGEDYIQKYPKYPNPYSIYCVYKDSRNNIWIGTATLGVCRYNGKSFDWISEPDVTEIHNGPANGVRSITEDRNGDFWFNTKFKYNIYNNEKSINSDNKNLPFYKQIKSIGCLDGTKDGDLNEYLSIVKDNNNNLWIALYIHGVWNYDGRKIIHYPVQVNNKNIPVYCLFKDNNGNIWLGTHENGVFKFNGETFIPFKL